MEDIQLDLERIPLVLRYKLEERRELIKDYYKRMERLSPRLPRYLEDVEHAMSIGLNSSVVSHLTYDFLLTISKATNDLSTYDYLRSWYILDDEYDKAYDIWKDFSDNASKIKDLINSIDDSYFDDDFDLYDFLADIIPASLEKIDIDTELLIADIVCASSVGAGLLRCLKKKIDNTEAWLESLKNGLYLDFECEESYDNAYLKNYNLYKKAYWPQIGANFRSSLEAMNFHQPITKAFLESKWSIEMDDFCTNPVGRLWRDFCSNKKDFYIEAKRIKLNEEQWKYLFMNICRFEEYGRWIEELQNPPELDEDKLKREALLDSNIIFDLDAMKAKHIDILRLYNYINDIFIEKHQFVYQWTALKYFLDEIGILKECTNVDFSRQMNDEEWFASAKKGCSDNEMNYYNFLLSSNPQKWDIKLRVGTNRATSSGVRNIKRIYSDLEISKEDLSK